MIHLPQRTRRFPSPPARRRTASQLGFTSGLAMLVAAVALGADDWPMYQHDAARSGITSQRLTPPLVRCWTFQPRHAPEPAWGPPKIQPDSPLAELPRVHFDDTPQVAVADGRVCFASSADGKLYCLDAATGRLLWTKRTGGPIRLAPAIWDGRVYVGSDDGHAYCLDARSGDLLWQFRAAPEDKRVIGSRRMISLWPLRAGVLVDDGVAYLAAGIFPAEGIFFYALDAKTGSVLWRNDQTAEAPQSQVSPQGYLLASKTTLYAPMGRASPAALDRRDGKLKYLTSFGGGSYALVADEEVYTGTERLAAFRGSPPDQFATYAGQKIVVNKDTVYLSGNGRLSALDRKAYPAASSKVRSLRARFEQAQRTANQKAEPSPPNAAQTAKQAKELAEQLKAAEQELARSIRWEVPCRFNEALILASDALAVGSAGQVRLADAASGKTLWSAMVEGTVKGLAVAAGRLLVSTDTGKVYCFGRQGSPQHGIVAEPIDADPYRDSPLASAFRQAAETILRKTGIRRGYCLVLDCQTGQLALELARRSDLMIYVVSPDADKVAAAQKALDAAGVYGTRVYAERWPADKLPYGDYFANLVVSEGAIAAAQLPADAEEMFRIMKPLGGTALLGQPPRSEGAADAKTLDEAAIRRWLEASRLPGAATSDRDGVWMKIVRGPIPGAGGWTHQYGNPGNTGCGDDEAVRCPLEVLWFGDPGPARMVDRHLRAAAPLAIDGRLVVQGENLLTAYDAYNGVQLWQREIPGAVRVNLSRDASNLAANHDALFVATGDRCLRLDPATGRTVNIYQVPPGADDAPGRWTYLAATEKVLYGSCSTAGPDPARLPWWSAPTVSDCLFAVDPASGRQLWGYRGKEICNNAIAIEGGKVLFAEHAAPSGDDLSVVALDAQSGQLCWRKSISFPLLRQPAAAGRPPTKGSLALLAHRGVLVLCGVYTDGHWWQQYFSGQFADRRLTALAIEDGKLLWSKPVGYRVRPLVIGDTLHAEPWAYDLRTGESKTRVHPITGRPDRWQFARPGHHCGCPVASPHAMFFRSFCLGYYDLVADAGTMHFGGQRPGCWVNAVPANGLLLVPEASAGCTCPFPNICSVAFKPAQRKGGYAYFSAPGPLTPVRRLGIDFGAPGDWKDAAGELWLGYPRPAGLPLVLQMDLKVSLVEGGSYFHGNSLYPEVTGAEDGRLFASGAAGFRQCTIPLLGKGDPPALYRVRLAFADPDNTQPGQRLFDIKLQGNLMEQGFDIVKEAGGRNRAVVKQFPAVRVEESLLVELVPKTPAPSRRQAPILQAIEVVRLNALGRAVPARSCRSLP